MTRHRYLRAYMAGVAVSALWFLLLVSGAFIFASIFAKEIAAKQHAMKPELAAEVLIFTMLLVPNFFGFWNIFYVALRRRFNNWSLGLHGALAPFAILPIGLLHARLMHQFSTVPGGIVQFGQTLTYSHIAIIFPVEMVVYYLMWKYAVGFFNRAVELPS